MRFFTISAALVAALVSGVVAEEPAQTTTLTRTLQRVVQTVTATRASAGVSTAPTGDLTQTNGTASYTQPSITVASTTSTRTGAAAPTLHFDTAGLAAVAGVIGYLAL